MAATAWGILPIAESRPFRVRWDMDVFRPTILEPEEIAPIAARDEVAPSADGVADTEARVRCPWCGEVADTALDPGSGPTQEYAEDCPVCCRAWQVTVRYAEDGSARVEIEREDDR